MTTFATRYGPWALVTGASSGIGAEFARTLAERGLNVVLVARRAEVIRAAAEDLATRHAVQTRAVACDLGTPDFMTTLGPALADLEIGLLVNNAGFSNTGDLLNNALEHELQLLHVNCRAPLILAHELGAPMKTRGRGGIIFLSSTVGLAPTPTWANYSASKAYDLFLAEALHEELRPFGVDVLAVCPGGTRTAFQEQARLDLDRVPALARSVVLEPSDVVATALASLGGKASVVVGWGNALTAFSGRFLPRRLNARITGAMIRMLTVD